MKRKGNVREHGRPEKHTMRRAAAVLLIAGLAVPAMAAAPAMAGTKIPPTVYYKYRGVNKTYKGAFSGDWSHCVYVTKAKYTQTVSCTRGATVTETISGNIGFSASVISANVGFNVSFASTVSSSISVTVKRGGFGWYDVGFRYNRYTIGMEKRRCLAPSNVCGPWSRPDTVTVQQHTGNTYHYFGTGAT